VMNVDHFIGVRQRSLWSANDLGIGVACRLTINVGEEYKVLITTSRSE